MTSAAHELREHRRGDASQLLARCRSSLRVLGSGGGERRAGPIRPPGAPPAGTDLAFDYFACMRASAASRATPPRRAGPRTGPVRDALAGLHDPAPVVCVHVHARVELVRPGGHARVEVRVRNGDRPHAAQLAQVRSGVPVKHGDAVPQDVALACARRGR
jgi:hypothetical protein